MNRESIWIIIWSIKTSPKIQNLMDQKVLIHYLIKRTIWASNHDSGNDSKSTVHTYTIF